MRKFFLWWILAFGLGFTSIVLSGPLQDKAEQIIQDYQNGSISQETAESKLEEIRNQIERQSSIKAVVRSVVPDASGHLPPGSLYVAKRSGFLAGLGVFILWVIGIGVVALLLLGIYLHYREQNAISAPQTGGVFGGNAPYSPPPPPAPQAAIPSPQNLSGQYARQGNASGRHSGEMSPDLV